MAMMKQIMNVGRKARTAYMKTNRPKTSAPKPMSDEWRSRHASGDPAAKTELKKHHQDAYQAMENRRNASSSRPAEKKKPQTVNVRGTKMQTRNFEKNFKTVAGYRIGGTDVSKKALRTQGPNSVRDALKGDLKEVGAFKKFPRQASAHDRANGFPSGMGPKRAQTDAALDGVKSGRTGYSLWTAHKASQKSWK